MPTLRRSGTAGMEPLPHRKKWRAILAATLVLLPAYWSLVAGIVAIASDRASAPEAGPLIAFGLAVVPFVFVALAFLSEHPKAPGAVVRAMGLTLLVGIPVSAAAPDAVTGMVAGIGAGGIAALRADAEHSRNARVIAVVVATAWAFVTVRVMPEAALVLAPALPFTSLGIADGLSEHSREGAGTRGGSAPP